MLCKDKVPAPVRKKLRVFAPGNPAEPLLWCGACFLLCAARAGARPLPLAACVPLLAGALPAAVAGAIGAVGGYLLLWGWEAAMAPVALSLSYLAAAVIFAGTPVNHAILSAALTGAVGAIFLLDSGLTAAGIVHLLLSIAAAFAAPVLWKRISARRRGRLSALVLLGCAAALVPPFGASVSAGIAVGLLCTGGGLTEAVLCGAAVDLGGALPVSMTGVLALGVLCADFFRQTRGNRRSAIFFSSALLWQLASGTVLPSLCITAALGALAGTALPELLPLPARVRTAGRPLLPKQEKGVERALETMYQILAREEPAVSPIRLAKVYDEAAERVCRCCVRRDQCWEQDAEDTYRDLCRAGEGILIRGSALRDDLPARFADRCRHTEGFLTAVNQSLDAQRRTARDERRFEEGRQIAAGQYLLLSRLLSRSTEPDSTAPIRFTPELAVGTACKNGNEVSGDRGATCRDRFGNFYVLLCDGMGTGPEARAESDRAAKLLSALLAGGVAPDSAMELLNGFYVLRKVTAFSTVDLLRLDLTTGEGTIYKWGAAQSYLRVGETVQKIGTVTPPPGCGVGPAHCPDRCELSLKAGETLVMVSDGAFGEETEHRLTSFSRGTVRDLASCLITLGESDAADDRTAVVLRLRSVA